MNTLFTIYEAYCAVTSTIYMIFKTVLKVTAKAMILFMSNVE